MTTWGDFKALIGRSRLGDTGYATYKEDQLLDCYKDASDMLCHHTAVESLATFKTGDLKPDGITHYDMTTDTVFALPADAFEPPDIAGLVAIHKTGQLARYLDPLARTPGTTPINQVDQGYWLWPENTLNLNKPAGTNSELHLHYFAYYPYPANDDAVLAIPRWAETPISYLVAAYALSTTSVESMSIDRFKNKFDSGNPEMNSPRVQQNQFLKLYELMMAKRQPQDRLNYFRASISPSDTY